MQRRLIYILNWLGECTGKILNSKFVSIILLGIWFIFLYVGKQNENSLLFWIFNYSFWIIFVYSYCTYLYNRTHIVPPLIVIACMVSIANLLCLIPLPNVERKMSNFQYFGTFGSLIIFLILLNRLFEVAESRYATGFPKLILALGTIGTLLTVWVGISTVDQFPDILNNLVKHYSEFKGQLAYAVMQVSVIVYYISYVVYFLSSKEDGEGKELSRFFFCCGFLSMMLTYLIIKHPSLANYLLTSDIISGLVGAATIWKAIDLIGPAFDIDKK